MEGDFGVTNWRAANCVTRTIPSTYVRFVVTVAVTLYVFCAGNELLYSKYLEPPI